MTEKRGKPTAYTEAKADFIVEGLSRGIPLAELCRNEGMPHPSTVRDWAAARPDFGLAISRARDDGEDVIAVDCLAIADDARNDYMESLDDGGKKSWKLNGEHIQRSKLRIETRLKLLAKWNPKKYGESLKLQGDKENPLYTKDLNNLSDAELENELAAIAGANGSPAASTEN